MLTFPDIDPIAFHVGSWPVRWYGLMYLAGFAAFWWLGRVRAKEPGRGWRVEEVDDLLFYGALGVILGGRLGYVIFYDLPYTLSNPSNLIKIWQGGMSFHGGLLGVVAALWFFSRSTRRSFFQVSDFVAPLIPLGLGFGRIGNFINGELWGKTTSLSWGMVFPGAGALPRNPSQLYQALLEGLLLFLILWFFSKRPRPVMAVSGLFLLGYGGLRFAVEFVRLPDEHLGYLAFDWLTMGQLLSVPMVGLGAGLLGWAYARGGTEPAAPSAPGKPARANRPRPRKSKGSRS